MKENGEKRPMDILETERLTLRPYLDSDEDDVIAILRDEEVRLTYMLPDFPTREDAAKLFRRLLDLSYREDRYERAICKDGRVIGFLNDVEIDGGTMELGYVIHPAEKNRGYATEALRAAIKDLFSKGYTAIRAGYFEENPASGRVMEKSGMTKIDKVDEIEYRGAVHRCLYYEIRKETV